MFSSTLDRHDVLAAIRKTHGSAAAFERANHFPKKSVNEVLRGRANARVKRAIDELLHNRLESSNTDVSVTPRTFGSAHGLSAEAKSTWPQPPKMLRRSLIRFWSWSRMPSTPRGLSASFTPTS